MLLKDAMAELDIESAGDFIYFEQFAALMENELDMDFDIFSELLLMPDSEALSEMTASFFEDLIKGVPDDDMELYAALQTIKDTLLSLAGHPHPRSRAFFTDELFRLKTWYLTPELVACTAESSGVRELRTPCSALMLFREEKLSGEKYDYDFSSGMPPAPDEYTLNILNEFSEDPVLYGESADGHDVRCDYDGMRDDYNCDDHGEYTDIPDVCGSGPDDSEPSSIDPYRDGFIDRHNPVIDGESYEEYEAYDGYEI